MEFIKKYRSEIILIATALIVILISTFIYLKTSQELADGIDKENEKLDPPAGGGNQKLGRNNQKIYVDIGGAVIQPDVYEVTIGARLKDVVNLANGLSNNADRDYFARNFNLARILTDQEKIYIPSKDEVYSGVFKEINRTLDFTQPQTINPSYTNNPAPNNPEAININTASIDELDQLPGVGQTTAQKIIQNRPYKSVDELLTKKILKKNIFENIKDSMVIN